MMEKKNQKDQLTGTQRSTLTKPQLEHQYKLFLIRGCLIYGKSYKDSEQYFNSIGFSLSKSQFTKLKKEFKSTKIAKNWFSEEALYAIEEDHMLSVERIRLLDDRLMGEFEQVSATSYYDNWYTRKSDEELIRNKSHNADLLLKIISQFQSIQETKTKMFSATPLVQELMEVHRREEDEANMTAEP